MLKIKQLKENGNFLVENSEIRQFLKGFNASLSINEGEVLLDQKDVGISNGKILEFSTKDGKIHSIKSHYQEENFAYYKDPESGDTFGKKDVDRTINTLLLRNGIDPCYGWSYSDVDDLDDRYKLFQVKQYEAVYTKSERGGEVDFEIVPFSAPVQDEFLTPISTNITGGTGTIFELNIANFVRSVLEDMLNDWQAVHGQLEGRSEIKVSGSVEFSTINGMYLLQGWDAVRRKSYRGTYDQCNALKKTVEEGVKKRFYVAVLKHAKPDPKTLGEIVQNLQTCISAAQDVEPKAKSKVAFNQLIRRINEILDQLRDTAQKKAEG